MDGMDLIFSCVRIFGQLYNKNVKVQRENRERDISITLYIHKFIKAKYCLEYCLKRVQRDTI